MAFDAASPKAAGEAPKQLTRKLGSRPKADKKDEPSLPQGQVAKPVRKRGQMLLHQSLWKVLTSLK